MTIDELKEAFRQRVLDAKAKFQTDEIMDGLSKAERWYELEVLRADAWYQAELKKLETAE